MSRRSQAREIEGIDDNGFDKETESEFASQLKNEMINFESMPEDMVPEIIGIDMAVKDGDMSAVVTIENGEVTQVEPCAKDSTPEAENSTNSANMVVIETYARLKSLRKVAKQLSMTYQQVRLIINEYNAGHKG